MFSLYYIHSNICSRIESLTTCYPHVLKSSPNYLLIPTISNELIVTIIYFSEMSHFQFSSDCDLNCLTCDFPGTTCTRCVPGMTLNLDEDECFSKSVFILKNINT